MQRPLVDHEKQHSSGKIHHGDVLWQTHHVNRVGCNIDGNKSCPCIGPAHSLGQLHMPWRRVKRDDNLQNPSRYGRLQANTEIEHAEARSFLADFSIRNEADTATHRSSHI